MDRQFDEMTKYRKALDDALMALLLVEQSLDYGWVTAARGFVRAARDTVQDALGEGA